MKYYNNLFLTIILFLVFISNKSINAQPLFGLKNIYHTKESPTNLTFFKKDSLKTYFFLTADSCLIEFSVKPDFTLEIEGKISFSQPVYDIDIGYFNNDSILDLVVATNDLSPKKFGQGIYNIPLSHEYTEHIVIGEEPKRTLYKYDSVRSTSNHIYILLNYKNDTTFYLNRIESDALINHISLSEKIIGFSLNFGYFNNQGLWSKGAPNSFGFLYIENDSIKNNISSKLYEYYEHDRVKDFMDLITVFEIFKSKSNTYTIFSQNKIREELTVFSQGNKDVGDILWQYSPGFSKIVNCYISNVNNDKNNDLIIIRNMGSQIFRGIPLKGIIEVYEISENNNFIRIYNNENIKSFLTCSSLIIDKQKNYLLVGDANGDLNLFTLDSLTTKNSIWKYKTTSKFKQLKSTTTISSIISKDIDNDNLNDIIITNLGGEIKLFKNNLHNSRSTIYYVIVSIILISLFIIFYITTFLKIGNRLVLYKNSFNIILYTFLIFTFIIIISLFLSPFDEARIWYQWKIKTSIFLMVIYITPIIPSIYLLLRYQVILLRIDKSTSSKRLDELLTTCCKEANIKKPHLVLSNKLVPPHVFGISSKSTIITIPTAILKLPDDAIKCILFHELSHVSVNDSFFNEWIRIVRYISYAIIPSLLFIVLFLSIGLSKIIPVNMTPIILAILLTNIVFIFFGFIYRKEREYYSDKFCTQFVDESYLIKTKLNILYFFKVKKTQITSFISKGYGKTNPKQINSIEILHDFNSNSLSKIVYRGIMIGVLISLVLITEKILTEFLINIYDFIFFNTLLTSEIETAIFILGCCISTIIFIRISSSDVIEFKSPQLLTKRSKNNLIYTVSYCLIIIILGGLFSINFIALTIHILIIVSSQYLLDYRTKYVAQQKI